MDHLHLCTSMHLWTLLFYYYCCCTVCTALLFSYSAIFIAASVRNKLIHSFINCQAVQGGQYGSAAVTANCYGTAPVSSTAGASFQLDAYGGCRAVSPGPLRAGHIQSSSSAAAGLYRRPAPYPSPQQYMLAKRTPFFYQHCANSPYAVSYYHIRGEVPVLLLIVHHFAG